ncbi:carbohydrate sulfotransferase 11-like [Cephus cinctus]|uniref:Carbohydrate sulfotransferase n=1 Tax=Cephus cinctus TaxID=211228 RepID=A0AAJ7FEC6_CEPCN|nr:carbohydrate sulfotransferase 11-like [Cephus cinctus]
MDPIFDVVTGICGWSSFVVHVKSRMQFIKASLCLFAYVCLCVILYKIKEDEFFLWTRRSSDKINRTCDDCGVELIYKNCEETFSQDVKSFKDNEVQNNVIVLQDMAAALQQVSEVCTKYNISSQLNRRHFLYSEIHKAMYCWIRKVASSSFTKLFFDMNNLYVTHDYYKEIDRVTPKTEARLQTLIDQPNLFKFLIVRHPFERIVSAYRDRIEDNSKYTAQAWIYVPKIFSLTRPQLFYSSIATGGVLEKIYHRNRRLKLIPSFKEFITWLLEESVSVDDVHWDQYHLHCSACDINYNFILKLENHTIDQIDDIFLKLQLNKKNVYLPRLEETHNGVTDFDQTCSYFKNLSQDAAFQLYERYKIDFEMFNYDYEKYVECAKGEN